MKSPDGLGQGRMEDAIRDQAQSIGKKIASALPDGWGFALLVFPLGEANGRMNYLSNADRETMVTALKELVARFEGRYTDDVGHA
jgi:hypothetical protein